MLVDSLQNKNNNNDISVVKLAVIT